MTKNTQWVKPLFAEDIPEGTKPEWNSVSEEWEYLPINNQSDQPVNLTPLEIAITKRDGLLIQSDYTQLPDAPFTAEQKQAWAVYRQQLRDLPDTPGFPDVTFPTPPQ